MMMMIEANIQFIIKTLKSQCKKASPLHLLMWSAEPEDSPITTHPSYLFTFIKSCANNTRLLQNNPYTSVQIRLIGYNILYSILLFMQEMPDKGSASLLSCILEMYNFLTLHFCKIIFLW